MAVMYLCHTCRRLNAVKNDHCKQCGTKRKQHAEMWIEWRENGVRRKKLLGRGMSVSAARLHERDVKVSVQRGETRTIHISGPVETEETPKRTWRELVEGFLRHLDAQGVSPGYRADNETYLKRFANAWGWDRAIDEITPDMIEDVRLSLRETRFGKNVEKQRSKSSCDRHVAAGSSAWNHVVRDLPNPFKQVKLWRANNQMTRFLTAQQQSNLLEVAPTVSQHLYEIIVVALSTGLRKSNILNLRRDEVDLNAGMIKVIQKGGKELRLPVTQGVVDILRSIPDNGTPYFWISKRTGEPYRKDWRTQWEKAKELAGIPKEFRFHDLRHDFGTKVLAQTGNLKLTSKLLGHSGVQVTTRYAHVLPDQLRSAVELVNPLKKQRSKNDLQNDLRDEKKT